MHTRRRIQYLVSRYFIPSICHRLLLRHATGAGFCQLIGQLVIPTLWQLSERYDNSLRADRYRAFKSFPKKPWPAKYLCLLVNPTRDHRIVLPVRGLSCQSSRRVLAIAAHADFDVGFFGVTTSPRQPDVVSKEHLRRPCPPSSDAIIWQLKYGHTDQISKL
ncbi:hypothetical protein K456DRAFT_1566025 [Colletotrichum gloeosporioides 23]|nr:hypothetical protein K456DRAFT_1566025 [Colletotrichum gloeosporioides 23]